ncbi:hypothetical protein JHV56_10000 [Arthrobacter sp. BHU FT2]|nr:hypothetical protein [Arthrobacter sp. BHU FT2]
MTKTARSWLNDLTRLYTPSSYQFEGARGHRSTIESRLEAYLGIYEMFEIGSLRHGTGVWMHSDADYMVSLKGVMPGSPFTMLNRVKETLQARFASTRIVISRPAVVCYFSNGIVEVIPAYPSDSGYWIANPAGGWMKSHPKSHNRYVNDVNSKHGGAVKMLARQLKVWKYRRDVPISSCYIEMRTAKHMDDESGYSPLWDLYLSLRKMRDVGLAAMNDPTGLGSRFGACSSDINKSVALTKLNTAVSRALRAKDYDNAGKSIEAVEQLKLLFNR